MHIAEDEMKGAPLVTAPAVDSLEADWRDSTIWVNSPSPRLRSLKSRSHREGRVDPGTAAVRRSRKRPTFSSKNSKDLFLRHWSHVRVAFHPDVVSP